MTEHRGERQQIGSLFQNSRGERAAQIVNPELRMEIFDGDLVMPVQIERARLADRFVFRKQKIAREFFEPGSQNLFNFFLKPNPAVRRFRFPVLDLQKPFFQIHLMPPQFLNFERAHPGLDDDRRHVAQRLNASYQVKFFFLVA